MLATLANKHTVPEKICFMPAAGGGPRSLSPCVFEAGPTAHFTEQKQGPEKANSLPKITQPLRDGARIQTQVFGMPEFMFCVTLYVMLPIFSHTANNDVFYPHTSHEGFAMNRTGTFQIAWTIQRKPGLHL